MKRQIIFRGKSVNTDKWLYGCLLKNEEGKFAVVKPFKVNMDNECSYYEIDEETIGQFTGLHDKNGKEIYEGDILKWDKYETSKHFQIEYNHGGFGYWYYGEFYLLGGNPNFSFKPFNKDKDFKVIGNIHDNPELLNS